MASLQNLGGAAELLLQLFEKELTALGVQIPERRYVAPGGMVAWDGDQLTVNLRSIDQGQPGIPYANTPPSPQARTLAATFVVSLIRSAPGLSFDAPAASMVPDSGTLDLSGTSAIEDSANVVLAAQAIHASYEFTGPGEGFAIGPCTPVGPQGGLTGVQLQIVVSLT